MKNKISDTHQALHYFFKFQIYSGCLYEDKVLNWVFCHVQTNQYEAVTMVHSLCYFSLLCHCLVNQTIQLGLQILYWTHAIKTIFHHHPHMKGKVNGYEAQPAWIFIFFILFVHSFIADFPEKWNATQFLLSVVHKHCWKWSTLCLNRRRWEQNLIIYLVKLNISLTFSVWNTHSVVLFSWQVGDIPSTEYSGIQRETDFSGTQGSTFLTLLMVLTYHL